MIAEFVGLPGSGKTYITKFLSEDPNFTIAEQRVITNTYRIKSILLIFKARVLLSFFFKIVFSFRMVGFKLKRLKSLVYLDQYEYDGTKVLVYDQHLIQNLISLQRVLGVNLSSTQLKNILELFHFPKNIIIIYNHVDLLSVCSRFKLRKRSKFHNRTLLDDLDDQALMNEMVQLKNITDSTLRRLKALGVRVLVWESHSLKGNELMKAKLLNNYNTKKHEWQ